MTLGTNLDTGWAGSASRKYGMRVDPFPAPDSLLAPLRPLLADADVVLLNVEGAIGEHDGAAVDQALAGLARDGLLERDPRDPWRCRLPLA